MSRYNSGIGPQKTLAKNFGQKCFGFFARFFYIRSRLKSPLKGAFGFKSPLKGAFNGIRLTNLSSGEFALEFRPRRGHRDRGQYLPVCGELTRHRRRIQGHARDDRELWKGGDASVRN